MRANFNISLCFISEEPKIVLLFSPSLLWESKYYYFARGDSFGIPSDYISPEIIKLIRRKNPNTTLGDKDNKRYGRIL